MTDYSDYVSLPPGYVPGCILCDSDIEHIGHIFFEDLEKLDVEVVGPGTLGFWDTVKLYLRIICDKLCGGELN